MTEPWKCQRRRGFTLVELLVVIVIIAALAAILVPAVFVAIGRAKQSKIAMEVANLSKALERYKMEYGEYPPDFSSAALLTGPARVAEARRLIDSHLSTIFRRRDAANDLPRNSSGQVDPTFLETLDPSNALVFWLQGYSEDPQYPISGPGERSPLFDFNKGTFSSAAVLRASDGTERIFAAQYYPSGDGEKRPYIYYNANSYRMIAPVPTQDDFNPTNNQAPTATRWAATQANRFGSVPMPFLSSTLGDPNNPNHYWTFAEPEKFQLISAGLDGDYGLMAADELSSIKKYPIIPNGKNCKKTHKDNITNFSEGIIGDLIKD